MSPSIQTYREPLLGAVRDAIVPLVEQLRSASAVLPILADAENRRLAAVRRRLAELTCQIEEVRMRRDAGARRLVTLSPPPKPVPAPTKIAFPFVAGGRS